MGKFTVCKLSSIKVIALATIIIATSGCPMQDKFNIVGRYKEATCQNININGQKAPPPNPCNKNIPTARASIVTIKTPQKTIPSIIETNFPDRALSEYIKVMADPKKSSTAEALRQHLAAPLKPPQESTQSEDWTVFDRNVIVTVEKDGNFNPADRLVSTKVSIRPENAQFESWDKAATENTTINAGTLKVIQNRDTETRLMAGSPPNSPVSAGLTQKFTQGAERVERLDATSEVDNLTVFSEDGGLTINRQGGLGNDLTGNTIIKARLRLDKSLEKLVFYNDGDYFDKMGKPIAPQKLTINSKFIYVPEVKDIKDCDLRIENTDKEPVRATVNFTYTIRHINSGDNSLEEVDDIILEKTFKAEEQKKVELIPAREFRKYLYSLVIDDIGENDDGYKVFIDWPRKSNPVPLCFKSFNEAQDMRAYLKHGNFPHPGALGNTSLGLLKDGSFISLNKNNAKRITVIRGCWSDEPYREKCTRNNKLL